MTRAGRASGRIAVLALSLTLAAVAGSTAAAPAASTAGTPDTQRTPLRLTPGRPLKLRLDSDDGRSLQLRLEAGQRAALRLRRQEGAVAILLIDPSGETRRQWVRDPEATAGSACALPDRADAAWVADSTGLWTVRILPPSGSPPLAVEVIAEALRPASRADRDAWDADREDARVAALLDERRTGDAVDAAAGLVVAREREEAGRPLALASDLGYLGVRFYAAGDCGAGAWEVAEKAVRRALELRAGALPEADPCVAESRSLVASVLYARGAYEEGERLEKQALAARMTSRDPDPAALLRSERDVALLLMKQGKYAKAEDFARRALQRAETGFPAGAGSGAKSGAAPAAATVRAETRQSLGEVLRNRARPDEALALFEEALSIIVATAAAAGSGAATGVDAGLEADILSSLSGLHLDRGEYDEAELRAREFLALLEAHPDAATPERRLVGRNNLGEIERRQGRLDAAAPVLEEALDEGRRALCPDNPTLLFFRLNLARLEAERGRPERARALHEESIAALEGALGPRHPAVAQSLHDFGDFLLDAGRPEEAAPAFDRALALREAALGPDDPQTASTRARRARARLRAGGEAAAILGEAERAARDLAATPVEPEAAIDALTLVAEIDRRLGRNDAATTALGAALDGIERLRPRRGGGAAERAEFLRRHLDDYDRMIAWRLERGDTAAAFSWAERSRARAFLDLMSSGTGDVRAAVEPRARAALEAEEAEAAAALSEMQARAAFERGRADLDPEERRRRLTTIDAGLGAAAARLQEIQDRFRNASPLWRGAVTGTGEVVSLETARRSVAPARGWLLEYRVGHDAAWLFAVPGSAIDATPVAVSLAVAPGDAASLGVDAGPLSGPVLAAILTAGEAPLLERLASTPGPTDDVADLTARMAALGRILVPERLGRRLRRAEEWVLVPDGPLAALPFEALVSRPAKDWTRARTWLDDAPPIRLAPSATTLANLAQRTSGARAAVLSVSNPDYGGRFAPLPATVRESDAVGAAFAGTPGADVLRLSGPAATESAVRRGMQGRRFVHLATHGFTDMRRSGFLAAIALALPSGAVGPGTAGGQGPGAARGQGPAAARPDPSDDGLLQLFEIEHLSLDADLVVLSACGTGAGKRIEGEGVQSLGRGFLVAGARRVVATLWPVADAPAATLVGELFAPLALEGSGDGAPAFSAALRDARRALRHDPRTAAPFYWAPFTLTGLP